ncbi:hypothetical protein PG994_007159 [Apiospora phragmitis]|uniref:Uncharacterized protein n=1 Tax=Apiospora phragmitis TaxID=2905665 RepID=A0ABR1V2I4_9PEZI
MEEGDKHDSNTEIGEAFCKNNEEGVLGWQPWFREGLEKTLSIREDGESEGAWGLKDVPLYGSALYR